MGQTYAAKVRNIANRLEGERWKTTQRENRKDYEQIATASKWAAILSAVIIYQNKHKGMSPTDQMLAKDTGLSAGQVQYHIKEMEKAGLIKDRKGWPRHIAVENATKVQMLTQVVSLTKPKMEERTMDNTSQPETRERRYTGRKAFMQRARQAAQAIVDYHDQHGRAPYMREIGEAVYGAKSGAITNLIQQMVDHGWLHHTPRKHHDLCLTGLGRAALFGQAEEQLHTDTRVNPMERVENGYRSYQPRPSIPRPVPQEMVTHVAGPPLDMEVRRVADYTPPPTTEPTPTTPENVYSIKGLSDVDLIIELTRRGFKVSR